MVTAQWRAAPPKPRGGQWRWRGERSGSIQPGVHGQHGCSVQKRSRAQSGEAAGAHVAAHARSAVNNSGTPQQGRNERVARIFLAEWTGLSLQSEHPLVPMLTQAPMGRGSRPAGNVATVGLRRWRRMCRRNQRDRLMSHRNILTNIASTTQPKRTAKRRKLGPALRRRRTKQERVLALLRHPEGTTIAAFSLSPSSSDWVGALIRENR